MQLKGSAIHCSNSLMLFEFIIKLDQSKKLSKIIYIVSYYAEGSLISVLLDDLHHIIKSILFVINMYLRELVGTNLLLPATIATSAANTLFRSFNKGCQNTVAWQSILYN